MTALAEPGTERAGRQRPVTIADLVDARSPGFDVLRLVLATLVLVSHAWPLGGFGDEPRSPLAPSYLTLGGFAVAGFFAMSGLLVGRSAVRRPTAVFARARVLRIVPGYVAAVVFTGVPVALLAWVHDHGGIGGFFTTDAAGPLGYVGRALLFPTEMPGGVHDTFVASTPYGQATGASFVNGSLWTLPYELRCYLVIGLLGLVVHRWGERRTITVAWAAAGALALGFRELPELVTFVVGPVANETLAMLLFVFLSGALAGAYGDRIRLVGWMPLAALAVAIGAGRISLFLSEHVGNAALAVVLPTVALGLGGLGARLHGVDLSYGVYLYAWPVQQLVAMYGLRPNVGVFIVVTAAITAALAAASWFGIERPAVRRWRSPSITPTAPTTPTTPTEPTEPTVPAALGPTIRRPS